MNAPKSETVEGERGSSTVNRALSAHSRMSSLLAMTLMTALGIGALAWYYANAFSRQSRARETVQVQAANRAQGDSALPGIGRIDPPVQAQAAPLEPPVALALPAPPAPVLLDEVPGALLAPGPGFSPVSGVAMPKSPAQIELERRLTGTVFASQAGAMSAPAAVGSADPESVKAEAGDLAPMLRPAASPAVRAQMLPTQRLLLPKGAFIDCTLETAIDSTLPGMSTCILATDVFGADGKVVLLERGTKLVGETKGQVQQGAARVFVLWTEARTPTGVIVPLASPGADELGRSGLPGTVDRHFWQRFGAAMLVSVVNGAVQSAVQSSRGGGTVIYSPSASQDVMTEVLKSTVNIPPTVVKHQGDRIAVLVARDLDFRSVYELRAISSGR